MSHIKFFAAAVVGFAPVALAGGAVESPILTRNPGFLDVDMDGVTGDEWQAFGAAWAGFDFFGDGNPGHGTLFGDMVPNTGGIFQTGIPATPGVEYEFTVRIQWETDWDAATYLALEFFAFNDATLISETRVEIPDEFTDAGYRRHDISAVAPPGTAFVRPVVRFDTVLTAGASRAATVDNIIVREADTVLSLNPGFEDQMGDGNNGDFWGTFGAAALDLDFNNNGNPGHVTFFADMEGNFGGVFQQGIPATPGESYTFTFDIAFEDNWDALTIYGLEFYGADDGFLVGDFTEELIEVPGAGYTTYQFTATAPEGFTTFVRPIVAFFESVGTGELRSATVDNAVVQLTSDVSQQCNAADVTEPFGTLDIDDVLGFLNAFAAGDPIADLAAPQGTLDIDDVLAFLNAFAAGCP